jgi:hypothetical protein
MRDMAKKGRGRNGAPGYSPPPDVVKPNGFVTRGARLTIRLPSAAQKELLALAYA